ncbi:MAG TPA: hypothetical protein VJA21_29280 [Verrucomicrobiae bacterium]
MKAQSAVVVERTFKVPTEKVWKAVTNPPQMRRWFFEAGASCSIGWQNSWATSSRRDPPVGLRGRGMSTVPDQPHPG